VTLVVHALVLINIDSNMHGGEIEIIWYAFEIGYNLKGQNIWCRYNWGVMPWLTARN